ncbi:hypothetical protein DFH07DRAFT_955789 [Mycena maculata]|uniref:Uncharacterized protein n=1 Tax=Mycena maculata TaxID=230809 RepID=A0AAD7JHK8_9AGAR|nr:hypothetical protein DFH07DRAFT_955789 [Mycena maculata]
MPYATALSQRSSAHREAPSRITFNASRSKLPWVLRRRLIINIKILFEFQAAPQISIAPASRSPCPSPVSRKPASGLAVPRTLVPPCAPRFFGRRPPTQNTRDRGARSSAQRHTCPWCPPPPALDAHRVGRRAPQKTSTPRASLVRERLVRDGHVHDAPALRRTTLRASAHAPAPTPRPSPPRAASPPPPALAARRFGRRAPQNRRRRGARLRSNPQALPDALPGIELAARCLCYMSSQAKAKERENPLGNCRTGTDITASPPRPALAARRFGRRAPENSRGRGARLRSGTQALPDALPDALPGIGLAACRLPAPSRPRRSPFRPARTRKQSWARRATPFRLPGPPRRPSWHRGRRAPPPRPLPPSPLAVSAGAHPKTVAGAARNSVPAPRPSPMPSPASGSLRAASPPPPALAARRFGRRAPENSRGRGARLRSGSQALPDALPGIGVAARRLPAPEQEQAVEAAQWVENTREDAARALQLVNELEQLDSEAPAFDEAPVIKHLKSASPDRAECAGGEEEEEDELNDEDDSDVEQEGENACDSCRKSREHSQCSRARPLGPPCVNKRQEVQGTRQQGSEAVAGPSWMRRSTQNVRGNRSDREVRDRTRKEQECRVRKGEKKEKRKEGGSQRFRELEDRVGYLGEQVGRSMMRYKLAYRACQLILKTLAAPGSGTEVHPGVERMLRWMAADVEASKWDFSLAEEAELDLVAEEPEEDEDAPPAKRRRLMKRGSPEVEEKEAEPEASAVPRARSASWPADFRVLEGKEDVEMVDERMDVDAPEAPEGPEGPDEEFVMMLQVASQVAEERTIGVLTFKLLGFKFE